MSSNFALHRCWSLPTLNPQRCDRWLGLVLHRYSTSPNRHPTRPLGLLDKQRMSSPKRRKLLGSVVELATNFAQQLKSGNMRDWCTLQNLVIRPRTLIAMEGRCQNPANAITRDRTRGDERWVGMIGRGRYNMIDAYIYDLCLEKRRRHLLPLEVAYAKTRDNRESCGEPKHR